ncbi:MAG TPA: sarcosine oxidase subunit gamma family protein [Steroidobacteraceae bacterium]|nr:sarcosine oxidase subunit gamma family protein [Steroidobacteraceae bacterium]
MAEPVATLFAQSALPAGGRVLADTLHLQVLPPRTVIVLKLGARSQKSAGDIRIAGRPLPLAVNTWSGDDPVLCRLGPDAWMLLSAQHGAAELVDAVILGCKRRSFAATDVSDAWVTFALEGPQATEVLARGCGLDFSEPVFGHGACTRTRFAQLPVLLRRISHERFELMVDRSAASWLHEWLQDAAGLVVADQARP